MEEKTKCEPTETKFGSYIPSIMGVVLSMKHKYSGGTTKKNITNMKIKYLCS